ncbi:centromere protein S [Paramormyrops kingsleyae]|uniref:centromere protein S n=1 Tax=Paramormyrops kingsleyae TaxID=1676925 RepID=UPI000CD60650|nr:centromere protein S-like [Paramormyrops kingsleyae]
MEDEFSKSQRLKAAVHFTVGRLCQEVGQDCDKEFSKQVTAAIAETTFRQCDNFAKDLEAFARHAKRTTINSDDVKLIARRSSALSKYITKKCEDLISANQEQKERKKRKSDKKRSSEGEQAEARPGDDDAGEAE